MTQVQEIHFSSYNTTGMLQVSVLQWCKTVCVCVCVCVCFSLWSSVCCWSYLVMVLVGLGVDQMLLCARVTVAAMEVCPQGCCSFFTVVCYAN